METETSRSQEVVVMVSGGPWEMGFAQGDTLRTRIQQAHQIVNQLEAFRLMKPRCMPLGVFRKLAEMRAAQTLDAAFAADFPDFRHRLGGICKGAGVNLKALYLFSAMESMLSEKNDATTIPPPGACSALAIRSQRSATGEPIIARNFDYLPLVRPLYTMRKTRPRRGFESLEFTMAPFAGAVDGVNEKGLCITYDYAYATDTSPKPSVPLSILIAEALQRCASTSEAAAWIQSRQRWGAGLLMIADASGDIASMELSSTRSAVRRPADGEDVIFHTNTFSTANMRAIQIPDNAIYTEQAPEFLRGRLLHESAFERARRLETLVEQAHTLDVNALAAIMADHGAHGEASDTTICVHSPYWSTTASLQLFPRSRRMRVAFDSSCHARYHEVVL
jgi:Acyl-coenzyme A:6-aminopenicillanic acid acyl-transferase